MGTIRVSGAVLLRVTDGTRFALLDKEGDQKLGVVATTMQVTPEGRLDLWERFSVTPRDFLEENDRLKLILREEYFSGFCQWVKAGKGIPSIIRDPKFQARMSMWELGPAISRLNPWKHALHQVPGRGPEKGSVWMYIVFKIYEIRFTPNGLDRFAELNPSIELVTAGNIHSGMSPLRRRIAGVCRVLI